MQQERSSQIGKILSEARFQFAIKCLHKVMQIKPKNNFAFSSYSIYEELLLVYLIFSGTIEESLKHILYLSDVSKYDLVQYYASRKDEQLQLENNASAASSDYDDESRCWMKDNNVLHIFTWSMIFRNSFQVFDPYGNSTEVLNGINKMIKKAVEAHIRDPVQLSVVRKDMDIVLMTALRFNVQKFQISSTCQSDASNVPSFLDKRKRKSFFSHELSMHVSEFPHKNENTSLFVLLPASVISGDWMIRMDPNINDIYDLIERLSTEEGICKLLNLLDSDTTSEDVTDFLIRPTFEVEINLPIRELLRALGAEELLMPDAIKMNENFADKNQSMHLGNAMHRTHVKVTEEDTIAGAITVIYTGQEISPNAKQVDVNHNYPFVWLIYDKQRGNVLFVGAFNKFTEPVS